MTDDLHLLQRASNEIKELRKQNELMSARLEVFDSMMAVLHTPIATKMHGGMAPDLVYEIDKYISTQPKSVN
jgi:hypothetical protein